MAICDQEAKQVLEAWGLANRIGGPKGYPKIAPFTPQTRGMDLEWQDERVDIAGGVVQALDNDDKVIVKLYFEPQTDGRTMKVHAIRKKTGIHSNKIHRALDRCIGRVAQALGEIT